MSEYQLRINGEAVLYGTELTSEIMDRWVSECFKDPEATKQIEVVRVKEDVIYNQYTFHKIRLQHEANRLYLKTLDNRAPATHRQENGNE